MRAPHRSLARTSRTWPFVPVLMALSLGTGATVLAVTTVTACDDGDSLRRRVLIHLTDDLIVPTQDRLHADADALLLAVDALCTTADPTAARAAWRAVRADWSLTAAFAFGPVLTQMQAGPLDYWPVREATIDAKIAAAPTPIDAAYIDGLGTSAKGLPALEYLLFADTLAGPRCAYARALADDIARRTGALADAWHTTAADALRDAGHGSPIYPSEQAGVDALVNATIENLYRMVKEKLDRPLGNLTGSEPDPALLESRYSGDSLRDLATNLDGFEHIYLGADLDPEGDPGLGALVSARDPGLDARIRAQLALARTTLAAVAPPLGATLTADRSAVQGARDEIDALRRLIKLDVASLLGVTLMLSDNDGD